MKIIIMEGHIKPCGNSAHIMVPKDWIGKKARMELLEENEIDEVVNE